MQGEGGTVIQGPDSKWSDTMNHSGEFATHLRMTLMVDEIYKESQATVECTQQQVKEDIQGIECITHFHIQPQLHHDTHGQM